MTTICFHKASNTVAVDSRRTSGTFISSDKADKIIHSGDLIFILSGVVRDIHRVVDAYPEVDDRVSEVTGFLIKEDVAYSLGAVSGELYVLECDCDDAYGSGADFAIAAMDFGKSAAEAVEYAKTRDTNTGGEVQVIKLGK